MVHDMLIAYLMTVSAWALIDKGLSEIAFRVTCIPSYTESQNGNLFLSNTLLMNTDGTYL